MTSNFKVERISNPKLIEELRKSGCMACGSRDQIEVHHIKTTGAGGDDQRINLLALCIVHHRLGSTSWHRMGPGKFLDRFPLVQKYLTEIGWEIRDGKLKHPNFDKL